MKKTLGSFTAQEITTMRVARQKKDGYWTPARPLQFWSIARLIQAWHVLVLKADALYWDED